MKQRIEKLRAAMAEKNYDGVLVTQAENRRYMSGFTGSSGYLVISQKDAVLLTDFRYTEQAGLQSPDYRVEQISNDFSKWFPQLIDDLGIKRLAFDAYDVSYSMFQVMTKALDGRKVELTPDEYSIELIRAVKEPAEVVALERAQDLTDRAFEYVEERLRPGMTESEIAWELEKYIREHGGEGLAFDTIVGAGPNGARPHHRAGESVIKEGEPIVIDMGAKVDGYCADMTRTVYLGNQDDQFKKIYDIVLSAQLTAENLIASGVTGEEADGYARKIIDDAGYGETFGHSLGHGIGLFVHELPRLSKGQKNTLEDGMVFSVEPGIYVTGWGGVRIEDLVVLENGKARVITKARKLRTE